MKKWLCAAASCLILLIAFELYRSKYTLTTTAYELSLPALTDSIRITQLTDLHDSTFGPNNAKLVQAVRDTDPDLIFLTGDLINSKKEIDLSNSISLIHQLIEIAPVYASLGNQEYAVIRELGIPIDDKYQKAGARLLERDYDDITIKGQKLRIGGIYGYCQTPAHAMETHREEESTWLMDFQDTDATKLLLCHMPVAWLGGSLFDWDVDLVLAGHAHGGQVRIPGIGGLWAPDQGWFPGEECGLYGIREAEWQSHRDKILEWSEYMGLDTSYYREHNTYKPSWLLLSRGLGNTDWIPRFNNIPEVVVIDLKPQG